MTENMTEEATNGKPEQTAEQKGTALAVNQSPRTAPIVVHDDGQFSLLLDSDKFAQLQRIATMYATSTMVPTHYQKNIANCAIALQMSLRLNIDPFMFMQKTYIVQGKPGMEAQLAIALTNARGPFDGPIQWKFTGEGDSRACTAFARHKVTGEVCEATVTWAMVEGEGWSKKSGSKWLTMPEMMFRYRSATFLARLYCPEVLMGMASADEIDDMDVRRVEATVISTDTLGQSRTDKLASALGLGKGATINTTTGEEILPPPPPVDDIPPMPDTSAQEAVDKLSRAATRNAK